MKVLHLITRLDPGGSAENTLLTCYHLVENGWQALLVAGPGWTGKEANVGDARVPVRVVPSLRRDPSPAADLAALWQIYRMLRRERPTILHTHSAKAGVLGRWAGLFARVPIVVHTPHGHVLYGYARGLKNWIYLVAERLCAPITDRLVALSEGEKNESADAGIGTLDKWVVIPSGVDLAAVAPRAGRPAELPLRVGCIARLEHVKGVDVLVRSARALASDGIDEHEVLVWGEGRERENLVELAADIGVTERVRFVGTKQPVNEFLRSLDVYVQPSRNEGMGRALVLAQAAALPTVASNVCGIPDVVRDGETGMLVAPDDPEALADAIAMLLRDAQKRNAFGSAARSRIMDSDETGHPRFSTAAMLRRLETLYTQLTDSK